MKRKSQEEEEDEALKEGAGENCKVKNIFRKLICNYENAHTYCEWGIDFISQKKKCYKRRKARAGKGVACDSKITMFSLSKRKIYFNFSRISFSTRSYACAAIRKKSANYKIITTIQNKIKKSWV